MPIVDRKGHHIHYEVRGREDAPPVLLIMGLGLASSAWRTLPDELSDEFRVITFDNRGTGRSSRPDSLFRVHEMADDAAAVLDAAGASAASVFGISMGGMIALELVLRHPTRVRSLALGCTYAGYLRSKKPGLASLLDFARVVRGSGRGVRETMARLLVSPEYVARDPDGFRAWVSRGDHAQIGTSLRQIAAVARHTTEARLREISVPTLIVSGDADRLVPVANSRHLAGRIKTSRLVELPGAGHCFPLERAEETTRLLREHFRRDPTA